MPSGEASSIDEHAVALAQHARERADHRLEVLELVVGRQADGRAHRRRPVWRKAVRMIGDVAEQLTKRRELPRNAELAAQFELLADLMELEGGDSIPHRRLPAAPPRGSARRAARSPSSRSTAAPRSCRGSARRSRRRSSRSSRTARSTRSRSARPRCPRRSRASCACPGSGPKTARRIWQELGITTRRRAPRRRPRRSGCASLGGLGAEVGGEDPRRARASRRRPRAAQRALLGSVLPRLRAVAEALAAHPAAVAVSIAGSARRFRETVRDLDLIATATDAAGADRRLLRAAVGRRGRGAGRDEGDGDRPGRAPLRPPRRPARGLRQPAPALHRLEGSQRRAARGGGAARALGLGVRRSPRSRPARCTRSRPRRRSTRSSATTGSRPSCARTAASSRRRATATLPELVELGDLRGDLHTHTTWSDGKDSLEAMVAEAIARGYDYYAICDHSHRLRDGRLAAAGRGDRAR